jgi:16S rRNA (guanine527-N7)-methyltransferase
MRDRERDPALLALLAEGLAETRLDFDPARVDSLAQLALLVARWGRSINLSGHRDPEAVARGLILDAAAMLSALPAFESFADLGSGAGFPGLPMAILAPSRRLVSVEARRKRVFFQRAAVRELGLANVEIRHGRSEALAPLMASMVVAQAVAAPEQALEWMLRWCEPGGLLVIPGSESPPELPDCAMITDPEIREYRVPLGGRARTLWCARRSG